jgi:hypothetical protein
MKENGTDTANYNKVAQRAYQLWEKSGRPQGKETEHWLQAEAEINREKFQGGRATSPSSAKPSNGGRRVFTM